MERRQFVASLVAGGCAGMCVDLTLFPLDTIKTRLQSQQGFYKAGGFRGIYAGVPSAAVGSFPNAAAFFVTYDCTKSLLSAGGALAAPHVAPVTHMLAASLGEIVACLIRVPTEVIKQRTQASPSSTTYHILLATLREEGVRGLYRGYGSTVVREVQHPSLPGGPSPWPGATHQAPDLHRQRDFILIIYSHFLPSLHQPLCCRTHRDGNKRQVHFCSLSSHHSWKTEVYSLFII
ncbi:S-adenosylmethionine mitochondrial carrier protein isoform X2 [Scophthalmus maximus]|uniref:S-adenosylmethionine mitochondrial carrier protein isoform X2 n=1 Tax=Scophthalmus maximus TaxID=52904 RepID=UPI0015E10312|nr:S-adenosylmethionine mitochondrial carrier protein isoform X2 [Scophthalmus maximus]